MLAVNASNFFTAVVEAPRIEWALHWEVSMSGVVSTAFSPTGYGHWWDWSVILFDWLNLLNLYICFCMSSVIALLSWYLHSIAESMFNTRSPNSLVFVVYCLLEATSALLEFFRPILSKTVDSTTHKKNTTSTYGDNYYRGRNWINLLCNVIAKPFLLLLSMTWWYLLSIMNM